MTFVPTKVFQINVKTDTKTKDNVTLTVTTAIQACVDTERAHDYFFKLSDPNAQVSSYVHDCIRSLLPSLDLDRAFESKDEMAASIKESVSKAMVPYGLNIVSALVTDMAVDPSVLKAMNEINASRRQREAAVERAEAEKILAVKAAEAEAEAKELSGKGTARMRQAITEGFKGSITSMQDSCGLDAREVIHMMITTQYLDVLKNFAESGKATMVVPHGPSAVSDISAQVSNGFAQAKMAPTTGLLAEATLGFKTP
eukprot:CAMPEP_0196756894 /NCGR_PEP_ID=MMETSP1091-20130531/102594_1 /TAXON_ID=302021 /ORGANISM="Rhodomonas sp., Strain CCMP768" /LENGTH=255 /DNA_ID=CAMNT_0042105597 /DNA_START=146 /DNA_END=913 /DNA_ORIENTATION=+